MQDIVSSRDLICGRLTLNDLYRKLVSTYGLLLSFSEFNQSWLIPYSQPMPGMRDLIADLAVRHTLVLLSNVDQYYWQTIQNNHEELKYFSHLILSWEVGAAKPDEEIFHRAMNVVGAAATECYLIDDKPENVNAAIGLGMQAHHFTNLENLKEALNKLGTMPRAEARQ